MYYFTLISSSLTFSHTSSLTSGLHRSNQSFITFDTPKNRNLGKVVAYECRRHSWACLVKLMVRRFIYLYQHDVSYITHLVFFWANTPCQHIMFITIDKYIKAFSVVFASLNYRPSDMSACNLCEEKLIHSLCKSVSFDVIQLILKWCLGDIFSYLHVKPLQLVHKLLQTILVHGKLHPHPWTQSPKDIVEIIGNKTLDIIKED